MPVDHAILTELRKLAWASSLSDETLNSISENVIVAEVPTGEVVLAAGAPLEDVYFVVQGRLSATIRDAFGNLVVSRVMSRGMAVGVFAMALGQDASLQVVATERTLLYRLPLSVLLQLTSRFQDFQLAMFRLAAGNVRSLVLTNRAGSHQAVVGVLHHSHATRQFAKSLIQRLHQLEETVFVVGDDSQWKPDGGILFETWFRDRTLIANEERQRQLESWRHRGRLLFDLAADHDPDTLARLLSNADSILWCVTPQDAEAAMRTIRRLLHIDRGWSQKICLVWILEPDTKSVPYLPELGTITARDFKVSLHPAGDGRGRLLSQGLERVVRYLRGIQIGLALGGGAARGMAHLGVLKALEDNGIFVDMVAGTSAGAMTGTIYASGMDPEFSTNCFKSDLQPSWFFRCLPGGGYWYLVHKYRRNRFDPMLRKYLDNARLEQLVVPMHTIAVDLVEGKTLVRSTGDAVHNILESINLPPLSLPIIKSEAPSSMVAS